MCLVNYVMCCMTVDSGINVTMKLHKKKYFENINLLHVSALGCHVQGFFKMKEIQAQHSNLD